MKKVKIALSRTEMKELLQFLDHAVALMEDPAGKSLETLFVQEVFGRVTNRIRQQLFSNSRNEIRLSLNMTESYVVFTLANRIDVQDRYRDMILRKIIMEIDKATI